MERALQRISQSRSVDWSVVDPISRAAMLTRMDPAYAAYEYQYKVQEDDLTADYFRVHMFGAPAAWNSDKDAQETNSAAIVNRFWQSPVGAENVDTPLTPIGIPYGDEDFFRGWVYLPRDIVLEYFEVGTPPTPVSGHVSAIRSAQFDRTDIQGLWDPNAVPREPARWGIVGSALDDKVVERQIFCHDAGSASDVGDPAALEWLREFPLLPNAKLIFHQLAGLKAFDVVVISMSGFWQFYPYFIEPGEEPGR